MEIFCRCCANQIWHKVLNTWHLLIHKNGVVCVDDPHFICIYHLIVPRSVGGGTLSPDWGWRFFRTFDFFNYIRRRGRKCEFFSIFYPLSGFLSLPWSGLRIRLESLICYVSVIGQTANLYASGRCNAFVSVMVVPFSTRARYTPLFWAKLWNLDHDLRLSLSLLT